MAQRITRAKKKIASAKVPYRVPEAADLPERLGGVLAVLFLVFNEGYLATGDGHPGPAELTGEAIPPTRTLPHLPPDEPDVAGLPGLLVLPYAPRPAHLRRGPLTGYHAWHAARADLLRRLGRSVEAKEAYDAAIAATQNSAERAYLSRKRGELV